MTTSEKAQLIVFLFRDREYARHLKVVEARVNLAGATAKYDTWEAQQKADPYGGLDAKFGNPYDREVSRAKEESGRCDEEYRTAMEMTEFVTTHFLKMIEAGA